MSKSYSERQRANEISLILTWAKNLALEATAQLDAAEKKPLGSNERKMLEEVAQVKTLICKAIGVVVKKAGNEWGVFPKESQFYEGNDYDGDLRP